MRKLCVNAAFVVISISLLSSCVVGPNYQSPDYSEMGIPDAWHGKLPHEGNLSNLSNWWEHFNDPILVQFVQNAQLNSPTLAIALAKVREARSLVSSQRASLGPSIDGSASVMQNGEDSGEDDSVDTTSSGSIDFTWELDLFGKNTRKKESANALLESARYQWHDARVTLAAEVAFAYTNARLHQCLIEYYRRESESREISKLLVSWKIQEGMAPATHSLLEAASTAETTDSLIYQKGLFAQQCNQLVMLTGLSFDEVNSFLQSSLTLPETHATVNLSVPANVVTQRPDVRAVERSLFAATSSIGVAEAEALPSLSLVGSIGINSAKSDRNNSTVRMWSFGPSFDIPIFQSGANAAKIERAKAQWDHEYASYRLSVVKAVREVEDALGNVDTITRRLVFMQQVAENYAEFFEATEANYKEGKSSLLDLEEIRRQSLSAQISFVTVQIEQAQSWIALYKALGGGWPVSAVEGNPEN